MPRKNKIDISKLAAVINKLGYSCEFLSNSNYNDDCYRNIASIIFKNDSKANRYIVSKTIKLNLGNILGLVSNPHLYEMNVTNDFFLRFQRGVNDLQIKETDSYYSIEGSYANLCKYLGVKNTLKNRLKFRTYYKRHSLKLSQTKICSTPIRSNNSHISYHFCPDLSEIRSELDIIHNKKINLNDNNSLEIVKRTPECSDEFFENGSNEKETNSVVYNEINDPLGKSQISPESSENFCEKNCVVKAKFEKSPIIQNNNYNYNFRPDSPEKISKHNVVQNNLINANEKNKNCSEDFEETLELRDNESSETRLFMSVSNEKEKIPDVFIETDKSSEQSHILPQGSKNIRDKNWTAKTGHGNCKTLEGIFILSDDELRAMCVKNKLKKGTYNYLLRGKIKRVNNVCIVNFKQFNFAKTLDYITVYGYCVHVKCKVFLLKIKNINKYCDHEVEVYSSSFDFNHLQKLTSHVRGLQRKVIGNELLNEKPMKRRQKDLKQLKKSIALAGNLGRVKSDAVYRKLRSEVLSKNDRHMNDIYDMIEMQRENAHYINFTGVPFVVYIFSKEQLKIISKDFPPVLHLDATGTIIRRPQGVKKNTFYYAGVIRTQNDRVCAVLELISSNHDAGTIGMWLTKFRLYATTVLSRWPLFFAVVVDFSFALLNAVSIFWNNVTLLDYLNIVYHNLVNNKQPLPGNLIRISICCCHFFKMVCNDINACFREITLRENFKYKFAVLFDMKNIKDIFEWLKNIYILLGNEWVTPLVLKAKLFLDNSLLPVKADTLSSLNESPKPLTKDKAYAIYKKSMFFQKFCEIVSSVVTEDTTIEKIHNECYSPKFREIVLKKYIPFIPLWTGVLLNGRESNAPVERYFGIIKNIVLDRGKNQKCSRVVRKIREYTLGVCKENVFDIQSKRCTRNKKIEAVVLKQCEKWKKAENIPKYFGNNSISKYSENMDVTSEKCLYCNEGLLDTTAKWIQCDECDGWVHFQCGNIDLADCDGSFYCKKCETEKKPHDTPQKITELRKHCENFLKTLTAVDPQKLEKETRMQRNSKVWHEERKKRITASNFGLICKACQRKTLYSITYDLHYTSVPKGPAIQYGINNEQAALTEYTKVTKNKVFASGLRIHPQYPYLGCSPDGLIGSEGIVEVKCPYSIRDCGACEAVRQNKIKYLTAQGQLIENSNYYFQIQGMLEILNRSWCDLVIYSQSDIFVTRIPRNEKFWNLMKSKLTIFYLNFFLPEMFLRQKNKFLIQEQEIKSFTPISEIIFFSNGLITNINYYKYYQRDYVVANYDNLNYTFKNLNVSDFSTLHDKEWLSNFVIDIFLHLSNTPYSDIQIFDSHTSFNIFYGQWSQELKKSYNLLKKKIVMPILVNGNHWCLIIADCEEKTFALLDPMGDKETQCSSYYNTFQKFLSYCFPELHHLQWNIKYIRHALQKDSYNCGIYILYFFKRLVSNESMAETFSPSEFRKDAQSFLLQSSSDMKLKCLFCGQSDQSKKTVSCKQCQRLCHIKCISNKLSNDYVYPFTLCDICLQYLKL